MYRTIIAAAVSALVFTGAGLAQIAPRAPASGPLDINAANFEGFEREGRLVYEGDVNAVRGDTRLRADRVEVFFAPLQGGGFGGIQRILASGDVYYITGAEIARGDSGVYDLEAETITLEGSVVLTQGCNVSTGERLVADLDGGAARLSGGGTGDNERVRSVFFDDPGEEGETPPPGECVQPEIPGDGPQAFDGDDGPGADLAPPSGETGN
ncbi:MAG: LptA/OstA family protein [Oceanicaulis sp.]